MTKITDEFLENLAYGMVEDFLHEGIGYLSFSEALSDNVEVDFSDSDVEKLANIARGILNELAGHL